MASTGLMRAVVETGYMENCYESVHYQSLDASNEKISYNLAQEIFGEEKALESKIWLKKAH